MGMIPEIDISVLSGADPEARRKVARDIGRTCETMGFLYISGHCISPLVIAAVLDAMKRFFAQDEVTKLISARQPGIYRGYIPVMPFAEQRDGSVPRPLYEAFFVGDEKVCSDSGIRVNRNLYAPNVWPTTPVDFREAVLTYFNAVTSVTHRLLEAFAIALGLEEGALSTCFLKHLTNISLLHYPARPEVIGYPEDNVHPHRDTNVITVLLPGEVGGLQVQTPEGQWLDIPHREGRLVVNIGNEMEIWSAGRFKSTMHRIHPPRDKERYSIGYFAVPDYETVIEPLPGLALSGDPEDMKPRHAGEDLAAFIASFDRFMEELPQ